MPKINERLVTKMEKTRVKDVEIVESVRKVYDRYEWLKARLLTRYNVYYDNAIIPEEILMINRWYEKMEKYLGKRFVREFSKAVANAKKEVLV